MPRSPVLCLNTLDDRREVHSLLERIPPAARLKWLQWCCNQVKGPHGDKIKVAARSSGTAYEVYFDFWSLCSQYDLDPTPAAERLQAIARKHGTGRRLWAASS